MLHKLSLPIAAALLFAGCASLDAPLATTAPEPVAEITWPGAVSSADFRATAAGEEILAKGGSATDAAIAVMLALTVVEPQSSGIGGGGFLVRADSDSGEINTYDGRETAPAAATPTRFLDESGEYLPRESRVTSGLSVGVPGNLALAAYAHASHGRLPWADLFQPAIRLARDGFVMNRRLNDSLSSSKGRADKTDEARAIFFGPDGAPLPVGSLVKIPELAQSLADYAERGVEAFYQSDATSLAAYVADETPQDGKMSADDVRSYEAKERPAVCAPYRSYRICGMGPPSSGGIAVAQMLGQLERFDLTALGPDSITFWHLFLESQRLAYADRELYTGDSDFVEVPVAGLVDAAYLAERSALIDPAKALEEATPGTPPGAPANLADGNEPPENGTTHFSVVDAEGNAVSYTSTVEGAFGSGLFYRGFYLNNELTDFSLNPKVGGKLVANRVEGRKRPRSSMAPTIVFDADGEVVLVIGAAGGPTIPVQVARSIIGVVDFNLSAKDAVGLPLIMAFGSTVVIEEDSVLTEKQGALEALGHSNIRSFGPPLKANALLRTPDGWEVAMDPRIDPMLATD
ncbi:gamma-glutamyltransferase [Altererythrobacter sp. GH1-8]|uniref:gamma-glutamyltransferase n=1 Tax=Altererythrobacter sp. GH1-8 TaxID=3349333 RepID=UPI00374CC6D6